MLEEGGTSLEGGAARVPLSTEHGGVEHARQRATFTAAIPAAAAALATTLALERVQAGAQQVNDLPYLEGCRVEARHLAAAIGG